MLSSSKHGIGFITNEKDETNGNWTISGNGRIKSHESWNLNLSSTCLSMEVEDNSLRMMGYSGWDSESMTSDMFEVNRVGRGADAEFKLSVSKDLQFIIHFYYLYPS